MGGTSGFGTEGVGIYPGSDDGLLGGLEYGSVGVDPGTAVGVLYKYQANSNGGCRLLARRTPSHTRKRGHCPGRYPGSRD